MRALTGFDRVKVYRFDEQGSGEVMAEALRARHRQFPGAALSGLRHSGPGAQALSAQHLPRDRRYQCACRCRSLPALDDKGQPLDLSLSVLRAVSPIHIEYLRNMGVDGVAVHLHHRRRQAVGPVRLPPLQPAPAQLRLSHRRRTVRPDVLADAGKPRARESADYETTRPHRRRPA